MRIFGAPRSRRSVVLMAALTLSAIAATATPAAASGLRFVNLHQCMYGTGNLVYTNILDDTPNTPFNTGTNASDTPDTTLACGPGSGWVLNWGNSAVQSLDRVSGRYLNLHQCVYSLDNLVYTNVLASTHNPPFNTGTNLSYTPDNVVQCGSADAGWAISPANTAVQSLDLAGGRYLNLDQCVYTLGNSNYTNELANTPNSPFNTGTNVSDTRQIAPVCGAGSSGWTLSLENSSVQSIDLNP